jgi:hypothetical protein
MNTPTTLNTFRSKVLSAATPFRSSLLHLIIIGIPVALGFIPVWDGTLHPWMERKFFRDWFPFPSASSMFHEDLLTDVGTFSTPLEAFVVHDMGIRFIYQYELSFVACFILRQSTAMHFFHQMLVVCSFLTILAMAWLQSFHFSTEATPWEPNFFARMVLCHLLAIAASTWTMSFKGNRKFRLYPSNATVARWSIPGTAVFLGSVCKCTLSFLNSCKHGAFSSSSRLYYRHCIYTGRQLSGRICIFTGTRRRPRRILLC